MTGAAFNLTLAMFSSEGATAAQNAWIVTHSRETLVEAMDLSISMKGSVELPVQVCRAKNGKYFVALGPGPSSRLKKRKTQYVASGVIPSDAFITQTCYAVEQIDEPNELPLLPLSDRVSLLCQTLVRCSVVKGSGGTFYPCNGAPDYAEKIYVSLTPSLNSATITDVSGQVTDFDLQSSEGGYHLEGGSYGSGVYDINRPSGQYSGMRLVRNDDVELPLFDRTVGYCAWALMNSLGERICEPGMRMVVIVSKAGNKPARTLFVELAWCWLRYQPGSGLAEWYRRTYGEHSSRVRKVGIVALARKLAIALWRFVEHGVVPAGAVMSPAR